MRVLAVMTTIAIAGASAASERERLAAIEELKNTIHTLPAPEAAKRFAELERRTLPPPRQKKIDHFVRSCLCLRTLRLRLRLPRLLCPCPGPALSAR